MSESHNANGILAAFKFYNHAIEHIPTLQEKHKVVLNTNKMRNEKNDKNVVRISGATRIITATPEQSDQVLDNIRNQGYKTATREMVYHIGYLAKATGGRIVSLYLLEGSELVINNDKSEIHFIDDKGGLSRRVKIKVDTADYLQNLKDIYGEGRLFSLKRKDGTFHSVETTVDMIEKNIKKAGNDIKKKEQSNTRKFKLLLIFRPRIYLDIKSKLFFY